MKILSVVGTRPEAIKMAPLVHVLKGTDDVESKLCITGQHREMLGQVLQLFDLQADHDLKLMVRNQSLNGLCAGLLQKIDAVLLAEQPDVVLVHGDTTTASAGALAAFHQQIAIGHVEAGLRSGNMTQPFPEEMNRRLVDSMASWLFAPTEIARSNLLQENLPGKIFVTGNTVIDALAMTCRKLSEGEHLARPLEEKYAWLDRNRRLLLVTGHRRESFGEGFRNICAALRALSQRDDVQIVYPVHLNPNVSDVVRAQLSGLTNVHLIAPLDYLEFVWFMQQATLILTDSGGVQEEAPYLGKPVLVMRDVTERPEAVAAGTVRLVGTSCARIVTEVNELLDDRARYDSACLRINPYGDGRASARIVDALRGRTVSEFNADQDHFACEDMPEDFYRENVCAVDR